MIQRMKTKVLSLSVRPGLIGSVIVDGAFDIHAGCIFLDGGTFLAESADPPIVSEVWINNKKGRVSKRCLLLIS